MPGEAPHSHPVDPERVARARAHVLSSEEAERIGELFRLLGDSVRARVLSALAAAEEMCVGDIALAIGARENSVSYALRQLRAAGLVHRRRGGRQIYYRLADEHAGELLALARRGAP